MTVQRLNDGQNATLEGGEGNDSIHNDGNNTKVAGGAGEDSIVNRYGSKVTIEGGAGDDSIQNDGKNVTIEGGAGDDSIKNKGNNITFQYKSGDGNDTISGFDETSTLDIGGVNYASIKSGDNLIVRIEDCSVKLSGAATLSSININGVEDELLKVRTCVHR